MSGANANSQDDSQGLDFDALALSRKTVPVRKNGREWWLRWDVPAEVIVERLLLRDMPERTAKAEKEIEAATDDAVEQAQRLRERMMAEFDAYRADVLRICHALFAHSYPDMNPSEVVEYFNVNEQRYIIDHFFTRLMPQSSPPPNGGSAASTSATAAASATMATANRASRRAATPRQKR